MTVDPKDDSRDKPTEMNLGRKKDERTGILREMRDDKLDEKLEFQMEHKLEFQMGNMTDRNLELPKAL